jgi:hypothetical protein
MKNHFFMPKFQIYSKIDILLVLSKLLHLKFIGIELNFP